MAKFFGLALLPILVLFLCENGKSVNASAPLRHYNNLIVGGGPGGLYTAWRLSSSEKTKNESTAIFEWSPHRVGGRVFTKTFPGRQFIDLGAMRFTTSHLVLQQVLRELNLTDSIANFNMTGNRLFYLRGKHVYQKEVSEKGVPYNTPYKYNETDSLIQGISDKMFPANPKIRAKWCEFFDEGRIPANVTSKAFKANDTLGNIGYWNLIIDQLDHEAAAYAADAGGFSALISNQNAAYSMFFNADLEAGQKFQRLTTGFSKLIIALRKKCTQDKVEIKYGERLTKFYWNSKERKFYSTFTSYNKEGKPSGDTVQVTSDRLFLCVPKRSLDLIQETDVVGEWPAGKERRVLKHAPGQFYINSVTSKPLYKVGLVYADPWWLNATFLPELEDAPVPYYIQSKKNYGPTVTDLPLRNVYYFGNNREFFSNDVYGIIATYDDMTYTTFWEELEVPTNETLSPDHPAFIQPLFEGTEATDVMKRELREQLNRLHFNSSKMEVPEALTGYFMNWGRDPFGAGVHGWKAHYKIAEAQYYMTRPSEAINVEVPVYVAGEAYSFEQGWIEGAFTTAETVLVDKIGLDPILPPNPDYPLICRPKYIKK